MCMSSGHVVTPMVGMSVSDEWDACVVWCVCFLVRYWPKRCEHRVYDHRQIRHRHHTRRRSFVIASMSVRLFQPFEPRSNSLHFAEVNSL